MRGSAVSSDQITREELRGKLDAYQDNFEASIRRACDQLVETDSSRTNKRLTLIWQMRVIPMSRDVVDQDNPIAGLLDFWVLAMRQRFYLAEGDGKALFGANQQFAINAASASEDEIAELASLILPPDRLSTTRERIDAVAREHPFRGEFSGSQVHAAMEAKEGDVLRGVLAIPLVPFRWLGGVDETAQAIKGFTVVAARLTDVVQGLASDARLQTQLLLLETEDMDSVKSALSSIEKVSKSSERLATVAEKLPEELRREFLSIVDDVDKHQTQIQSTLAETRKLSEQLERTGTSVAAAGEAWSRTAKSIEDMVASFRKPSGPTDAQTTAESRDGPAFDINDYRRTAEALTETANRLSALVRDLRGLVEEGPLAKRTEEFTAQANQMIGESSRTADRVTDHAAWRAIQIILFGLMCAVIYRVISLRLSRAKP